MQTLASAIFDAGVDLLRAGVGVMLAAFGLGLLALVVGAVAFAAFIAGAGAVAMF